MGKSTETTPVNGGWIKRDRETGALKEVGTERGTSRVSARSQESIREVSQRRSAALDRLAKR